LLILSKIIFSYTVHHWDRVCNCCSQILWIVHAMRDFEVRFERVPLMCDNTSAISIAKNPVFHKKMRHVERRHHFLRDHVEKWDIEMRYIDTERQLADIFTKLLDSSRFANLPGGLVFTIHMAWFEGGVGAFSCILHILFSLFAFSSYSPKSLCFTCYTSLYLLNYIYHCARMSSNKMWTLLLDYAR
jgi:hypothetical protein